MAGSSTTVRRRYISPSACTAFRDHLLIERRLGRGLDGLRRRPALRSPSCHRAGHSGRPSARAHSTYWYANDLPWLTAVKGTQRAGGSAVPGTRNRARTSCLQPDKPGPCRQRHTPGDPDSEVGRSTTLADVTDQPISRHATYEGLSVDRGLVPADSLRMRPCSTWRAVACADVAKTTTDLCGWVRSPVSSGRCHL